MKQMEWPMNTCTCVQGEAISESPAAPPEGMDVSGRKSSLEPPHLLRACKRWLTYLSWQSDITDAESFGKCCWGAPPSTNLTDFLYFSPLPDLRVKWNALLFHLLMQVFPESLATECPLQGQWACVLPEALWPQENLGRKAVALAWRWPAAVAAKLYRLHVNVVLVLWSMRCCIFNVSLYHYFNAITFFIYAV